MAIQSFGFTTMSWLITCNSNNRKSIETWKHLSKKTYFIITNELKLVITMQHSIWCTMKNVFMHVYQDFLGLIWSDQGTWQNVIKRLGPKNLLP